MGSMTTAAPPVTTAALMEAVAAVSAAYFLDFATSAGRHGLSSSQAKALGVVLEPVPMRALAGRLGCDASNVTGIVDRLESLGFARREAAATDRRVKIVTITEPGREVLLKIRADMTRAHRALDSLSAEQRAGLLTMCQQLLPLLAN
ncbi:MarR family winged helix-turn-helix transcriptional regulator [Kitasatospora kifunensis]|uniref:DNA-binding MarR family transcriptional regulator n=1 Tax=Kitasatospora kifunensis TaxID=58351 RepID=A0A7W7QZ04_KITKI|nr:MarR family transcriptional regulator [Kitasatospora kifunensis]MBB4921701.1 DNA-binding MarR family transcriptional regulator [Kitasatospora kifunensis]